jgi:hypothetical protein
VFGPATAEEHEQETDNLEVRSLLFVEDDSLEMFVIFLFLLESTFCK